MDWLDLEAAFADDRRGNGERLARHYIAQGSLRCDGCGRLSFGRADGWRGCLAPGRDAAPAVVIRCPVCTRAALD